MASSLNNLGDIYAFEGLFDMAADCYARALEMDPARNAERAMRSAHALSARGALAEASLLMERIEELAGDQLELEDRTTLLRVRASNALAAGADAEQAAVLEEIVALNPLDGDAIILLGDYYVRAGEPERAVLYYERAANIEAFEARAKTRHGELLVSQTKYAEALPLLRRAQALDPRDHVEDYLQRVERFAKAKGP